MQEKWKNVRQAAEEGRYEDIPEDVRFLQYKAVEHHRLVGKKRCISERTRVPGTRGGSQLYR